MSSTLNSRGIYPFNSIMTCLLSRYFSSRSRNERSEEHTSELQSRGQLVCRLLLEKKKSPHLIVSKPDNITDSGLSPINKSQPVRVASGQKFEPDPPGVCPHTPQDDTIIIGSMAVA